VKTVRKPADGSAGALRTTKFFRRFSGKGATDDRQE
jgi:hypothetical protein